MHASLIDDAKKEDDARKEDITVLSESLSYSVLDDPASDSLPLLHYGCSSKQVDWPANVGTRVGCGLVPRIMGTRLQSQAVPKSLPNFASAVTYSGENEC